MRENDVCDHQDDVEKLDSCQQLGNIRMDFEWDDVCLIRCPDKLPDKLSAGSETCKKVITSSALPDLGMTVKRMCPYSR